VLPVADASSLATIVDGVVLSARYGVTHKELLRRAVANLEQVGAVPLGIVMNMVPAKADVAEGYGYRYDYDSGS
jgi:Mrp family chromosome partitioning ATPase